MLELLDALAAMQLTLMSHGPGILRSHFQGSLFTVYLRPLGPLWWGLVERAEQLAGAVGELLRAQGGRRKGVAAEEVRKQVRRGGRGGG
jgi:hypothetical protein